MNGGTMEWQLPPKQFLAPQRWTDARRIRNFGSKMGFKFRLPNESGVYAIYNDGELVYIGSAANLATRVSGARLARDFDNTDGMTVKYRLERELGESLMAEVKLILRLRPPMNVKHNPNTLNYYSRRRNNKTN